MLEFITVNGTSYKAKDVTTSSNAITFTLIDKTVDEAKEIFKDCTALTVGDGEVEYGDFKNLYFQWVQEDAEEAVSVCMGIYTDEQARLNALEASQESQDEVLDYLLTE